MDPERAARLVAGAARVLRAGQSMAALHEMALRQQAGSQQLDGRKPCAEKLDEEAHALRAWYVTLGDSVANGTAVPPPQRRDPAHRRRLLQCTRQAIGGGQPSAARDALLVLWTSEHLDMLWRLEKHLGRPAAAPDAAPAGQE